MLISVMPSPQNQRVVPVIVTIILVVLPRGIGLGRIVGPAVIAGGAPGSGESARRWSRPAQDRANVTLQMNRKAQPCSRGENHRAPPAAAAASMALLMAGVSTVLPSPTAP